MSSLNTGTLPISVGNTIDSAENICRDDHIAANSSLNEPAILGHQHEHAQGISNMEAADSSQPMSVMGPETEREDTSLPMMKKISSLILFVASAGVYGFLQVSIGKTSPHIVKEFYYMSVILLSGSAISAAPIGLLICMMNPTSPESINNLKHSIMVPTCLLALGFIFSVGFLLVRG